MIAKRGQRSRATYYVDWGIPCQQGQGDRIAVRGAGLPRHLTARAAVTPDVPREGFHEGKEADPVQGDPADARREGSVPDRRWRPEWRQRPAAGRTEHLPEHQGPGQQLHLTRRRSTGWHDSPERGVHEGKEADPVQGDPADARREGSVPDRRWRPEWRQHPAAGRTERVPEHQGAGLLLTRTRTTGYR